ncbi:hypothetical protein [Paenibacillus sp. SYP-B4298]|nr:hypothetical protein [Paenibacillus sp. SYP-B4298]
MKYTTEYGLARTYSGIDRGDEGHSPSFPCLAARHVTTTTA